MLFKWEKISFCSLPKNRWTFIENVEAISLRGVF